MEIKEFGEVIARELRDVLGEEYAIECRDVVKNNGVVYHAVIIRKDGDSVAPTIYIDEYYKEYNNGAQLMRIVKDVVNVYRSCKHANKLDVEFFYDFANVSGRLFFKAVNYKKNKDKLKNVPIKRALDLALVPLCFYHDELIGDGSIMINNSHLDLWEITKDELWENVITSAPKVAPPKITGLADFLSRITGEEEIDELCGLCVISNASGNFGAGTIFYPDVLKSIADDYECDLYIFPSSIHECIVVPDIENMMGTESMRDMIKEVNRSTVANTEILSDNLYKYDRYEDRFLIVKD